MLAAEIASTTAKPSMILARNRRVGSLKDEPLRFRNRTSSPRFRSEKQASGGRAPNPVRKLKAEWIKVRKSGQSWQRLGGRPRPVRAPGREGACANERGSRWVKAAARGDGLSVRAIAGLSDWPPVAHLAIGESSARVLECHHNDRGDQNPSCKFPLPCF